MIGWRAFGVCLWRSIMRPGGTPVRWGRGRILAVFVAFIPCLILGLIHRVAFLLDDLLFPGYRRIEVKEPLFMVGPPRCGTTFLHRLLAKDTERFTSITLGEMVFAPSIIERKMFLGLVALDRLLGRPIPRFIRGFERIFFGPHERMHKVSFFEPEEDYILLGYIFACHLFIAPFPFRDVLGHLFNFDRETPAAEREQVMRFYKSCVQRHLYVHGADKIYLSKNPFFSPMVRSLEETFPDARFLVNVRTPYEAVPSYFSLWNFMYSDVFQNRQDDPLARDFMLDFMQMAYKYPVDCLAEFQRNRFALVRYVDLVGDPRDAVELLYAGFGWEPSENFTAVLEDETRNAQGFRSGHTYSLDATGLSPEQMQRTFAEVFARYDFPEHTSNT